MAEHFGPHRVHWLLLGPSVSLGWPAELISCSPLPADLWEWSLEFVVRGVRPALVGEDSGSGGLVGANNGSGVVSWVLCPAHGPTTSWYISGRVSG